MKEILCSTGALLGAANHRNYHLLGEYAKQLQCDGFEFMLYSAWYQELEQIASELMKMQLHIPVLHCEKHIGEKLGRNENDDFEIAFKLFERNCQFASSIKAKILVIHLWDGQQSDQTFHHNGKAYQKLQEIAVNYGLLLTVENVVCNQLDPMTRFRELRNSYSEISFTYDTKMAAFHNQIDLLYEEEWSWLWKENHIKHIHMNDYSGGYLDWAKLKPLHIGDGDVNFKRFSEFLQSIGYTGDFTVEPSSINPDGSIDYQKLNQSFQRIREMM